MKIKRIGIILLTLAFMFIISINIQHIKAEDENTNTVKNVILLIPDGMTIAHTTLARWYQGGESLNMDEMACGLIRTYNADSPIADSAPAATAMATGYKSHTGFLSVLPDAATMYGQEPISMKDARKPVVTVLEAAKEKGMSVGLVATCQFPHATPAAFASHSVDRNDYENIAEQMVYENIDVLFAGGWQYLSPAYRKDKEDLTKVLEKRGYKLVYKKEDLKNILGTKIWGLFAQDAMSYDFDRNPKIEPSLAEMTERAIQILSKNNKGFFLMVEGSKIDWASHANDPVGVISDVLAFDNAVKVALDFAKENGNTAVIIAPDHTNGGMTIGNLDTSSNYDEIPLSEFMKYLSNAKLTGEGIEKLLGSDRSDAKKVKEVVLKYYGIELSESETNSVVNAKSGRVNYVLGPMISKRSFIGWTTNGHTGEEVVLYAYHPNGYIPKGVIDNTNIANYISEVLELDLDKLNNEMFISDNEIKQSGFECVIDKSDKNNLVLKISLKNNEIKIPQNKDMIIINGNEVKTKIINIYNGKNFYISKDVMNYIR